MISRRHFLAMTGGLIAAAPLAQAAPPANRPRNDPPKGPLLPLRPCGRTAILGAPTATSIRLNLLFDEAADVAIRLEDQSGKLLREQAPVPLQPYVPHDARLDGLTPATVYRYAVYTRGNSEPVIRGSFRTQRPPGESFRFIVQADPHNRDNGFSEEIYRDTMRRTLEVSPDFLIDLGDNFMTEKIASTEADARQCVLDMRPFYGLVGHSVPLFLMNGNHEAEAGWLRRTPLGIAANRLRRAFYPCPTPDGFYTGDREDLPGGGRPDVYTAWHWGDALFVLLDPFWYTTRKPGGRGGTGWDWTLGEDQYRWLVTALRGSRARAKFVFCHHLVGGGESARGGAEFARLYEWGGLDADGTPGFARHRPGWDKPIHHLMVETGVTAFFHGHDHFYAAQELDGISYQLVPQPSHRNMRNHSASEYGYNGGVILPNSGCLLVEVTSDFVEVSYLRHGDSPVSGPAHAYRRSLHRPAPSPG